MTQPQIITRPYSASAAEALIRQGIPPLLARLYVARGLVEPAETALALSHMLPPGSLSQAEQMAVHLADAIRDGKRILIVADYDSDGATACAVAVRALRLFGGRVDYIVPNRFEYGYGLTPEIVHLAAARSPDILVTVDNGIASHAGVAEANRLGMQVLVTDHHLPADTLPEAACIVNPNQPSCLFPSKNTAGVGVIFYVMLALRAELRKRNAFNRHAEPNLGDLLDLVALGTVADVVRLDRNNRILVEQGLGRIRAGRACAGIQALLRVSGRQPARVTSQDLGFALGPRLNAAGRLDDMSIGIECLLSDDPVRAMALASQLDAINRQRREIEAGMKEEALARLDTVNVADNVTITLFDPDWHQGVIGIVASRIKERYNRPVIVFARDKNGEIKGSGRSIPGFHLRDGLDLLSKRHPALILKFGGHAMAAGLAIREQDLQAFIDQFEAVSRELLTPALLTRVIETDGCLETEDMTLDNALLLERQVWGQGFPPPAFEGEFLVEHQRIVGEKHLKLRLGQNGRSYDSILFFHNEPLPAQIRAIYGLEANEFNGQMNLQLRLEHWQPAA